MITFTFLSLVTSVKDYVEITHKLIEIEPLKNYTEFGAVFTYFIFSIGDFVKSFFSFSILKNIWSIPIIIPDIASAMISEVSVLDGYFHNAFTFLETNLTTTTNPSLAIFEKFMIGLINSCFLFLPTSTSHLITLRRFVMQGLEAGYMAGLGTLAGNFLWLSSIILGWRFFVIPWLSLDIFRYLLGFMLLVKYIWDSSKERRIALEDLAKWKIFLLNFLLALTEQSCIYPFISNLSIGPDASILEGFPVQTYTQFLTIHGAYLFGILLGSFSLLQFTCWFWENPAFSIYLWITTKSSLKITTSSYYKILNFSFLYATMLCAIASIPYYGLDYTITNPIGLVPQDRILDQKKSQSDPDKLITETAFLNINPTDKNSRIRDGVHARRERWKQRLIKYQAYDASLYDQGVYDFLTMEDLNYGFDRFWLRRKMRNHQIRFRLFPGPWMRSLKKQLNNPGNQTLETSNKAATGPRVEFFRILFEQFYHPNFHDRRTKYKTTFSSGPFGPLSSISNRQLAQPQETSGPSIYALSISSANKRAEYPLNQLARSPFSYKGLLETEGAGVIKTNSALRKFVRNFNTRINLKLLKNKNNLLIRKNHTQFVYSKRWKNIFSKKRTITKKSKQDLTWNSAVGVGNGGTFQQFRNLSQQVLLTPDNKSLKLTTISQKLLPKERKILELQTFYKNTKSAKTTNVVSNFGTSAHGRSEGQYNVPTDGQQSLEKLMLLRPLNIYLQKDQAFKRKLRYYGAIPMRKLTVGNQAPFFKTLMKRGFYYYKPSLRLNKTLYVASMRRGFRKKSRKQQILIMPSNNISLKDQPIGLKVGATTPILEAPSEREARGPEGNIKDDSLSGRDLDQLLTKPTHSYSVLGKRASRYRHQIYKDVLQHWYYTPFNRLLLKFDVDAFINRQPKTHFLTKNEERLLHIRRFLLSEHYDTLRWYTYMQHYRTMKTNIGGTKSFANRTYNQQFQGTFKKIRHLFAITPKQGDFYTLKFDQPLYNDSNLKDKVYFHEELLIDENLNNVPPFGATEVQQLAPTSVSEIQTSLNSDQQIGTFNSKNAITTFQAARFSDKEVNNFDLINQSSNLIGKQFLNKGTLDQHLLGDTIKPAEKPADESSRTNLNFIYNELFVKLVKECKKRVHNQAFLKNYITHRIEKREQLNQEQTKELNKRLDKLKMWLTSEQNISFQTNKAASNVFDSSDTVLTTGMQKAVNESIAISSMPKLITTRKTKSTVADLKTAYTLSSENEILTKLNVINALEASSPLGKQIRDLKGPRLFGKTKDFLQTTINKLKPVLVLQTQWLKAKTDKNLQWWRKKQRVITKRKTARKRDRFKKQLAVVNKKYATLSKKVETEKSNLYKTLYGNFDISDYMLNNRQLAIGLPPGLKVGVGPEYLPLGLTDSATLRRKQDNLVSPKAAQNIFGDNLTIWKGFFNKKLRKKASAKGRRYRSFALGRYVTATRKPRLVLFDDLTKIDNINSLNGSFLTKEEKQDKLNIIRAPKGPLVALTAESIKKSQIKKRSRHRWKLQKRHLFNKTHYKYRKRHIHGNGKLRNMNKKLKKLQATYELRQWWWKSFLPRYLTNLNSLTKNPQNRIYAQRADTSFKPLSNINTANINNGIKTSHTLLDNLNSVENNPNTLNNTTSLELLAQRLSGSPAKRDAISSKNANTTNLISATTIPFYAGWDESLRKFVVTNRLLSRRDTGLSSNPNKQAIQMNFTNTPIQGLNEGSFLYWQTDMPFNAYNIDQFITTNQSFYAPLGWRRFEFRHSILKTWINQSAVSTAKTGVLSETNKNLSTVNKIKHKTLIVSKPIVSLSYPPGPKGKSLNDINKQTLQQTKKMAARRVKKRYKLVKQMPNQLMYSPTGPLLIEVLPSHYISVFDQQSRFPRNRYLKRNLLKTMKKTTLLALIDKAKTNKEFTLRKRVKPRRKYHRKRFIKKDGLIFPRRMKFTNSNIPEYTKTQVIEEDLRWRPSSRTKQKRKESLQAKAKSNKRVKTNPLRLRQLRRREFQQVVKPIQRYIPRNGGFTWPGDYLRLEVVSMPKLKSTNIKKTSLKQKINVQPVGIMPRKYLIQKHNILVLKKKLEKAYSTQQLSKFVKEYKTLISNKM